MKDLGKKLKLHHIGIVARDEAQIEEFKKILELKEETRETIEKYNVTNVFLTCGGDTKLHFMIPHKGVLKNYNRGRGGFHHIAFCAEDIAEIQKALENKGIRFIAAEKQEGVKKFKFNFVVPNIAGLNIEFIEDPDVDWHPQG
ncbi:MAG: VOC family protein [Candidatus Zixiibacteriota bacterium]|nr:MAG: VOC family protein [candidate division Zixibacteria bacterium]